MSKTPPKFFFVKKGQNMGKEDILLVNGIFQTEKREFQNYTVLGYLTFHG